MKDWMWLVIGVLVLLYIAGWTWINVEMRPFYFKKYVSGTLILDSLAIYKQGFGILINHKLYGFEFTDRFFYSPFISWILLGGAIGSFSHIIRGVRESLEEWAEEEEEKNNGQK